jgi:hypothetical protein
MGKVLTIPDNKGEEGVNKVRMDKDQNISPVIGSVLPVLVIVL